jgi:hypothetical protein
MIFGEDHMKAKILSLLISMLLIAVTGVSVTGTQNLDANAVFNDIVTTQSTRAPWDLLAAYDVGATGQTGANGNSGSEFGNGYHYTTRWAANLIHQYDIDGVLQKEFSIGGVSGLRDLAYNDDTGYFHGGAAGGTIWEMDFESETLIGSISGGFQARAIAYNPDDDVFYCSNFGDPMWVVDASSGTILDTITLGTTTATYGFAYDPAGPWLWVWDQGGGAGTPQYVYQWDLDAGAYTGFTYDVGQDVGSGTGIAGGLWLSEEFETGLMCIGGCYQDSSAPGVTDWIFVYDLYTTNGPPAIPSTPAGPDNGATGVEYTFTTSTTDPEGEDVYYKFDWGDGTISAWFGPFASGATGEGAYIWTTAGIFDVRVKAKDVNGGESDWSDPHPIDIAEGPILEIKPLSTSLFKVKATIKNAGAIEATDVPWSITLDGGAFIGKETTGTIASIPPGGMVEVQSGLVIGLGATIVTVTAEVDPGVSDLREQGGTVLLFVIIIKPGGG